MHHQINITLPDETIELIDQVVDKGDRQKTDSHYTIGDRLYLLDVAQAIFCDRPQ